MSRESNSKILDRLMGRVAAIYASVLGLSFASLLFYAGGGALSGISVIVSSVLLVATLPMLFTAGWAAYKVNIGPWWDVARGRGSRILREDGGPILTLLVPILGILFTALGTRLAGVSPVGARMIGISLASLFGLFSVSILGNYVVLMIRGVFVLSKRAKSDVTALLGGMRDDVQKLQDNLTRNSDRG